MTGADVSLCDRCYAPGQCCKRLTLSTERGVVTTWVGEGEAERQMAEFDLPFVVADTDSEVWKDAESGAEYVQHAWSCTKLSADGRCTIYESRPQVCRTFEPASEPLCVHFRGAEGGDFVE